MDNIRAADLADIQLISFIVLLTLSVSMHRLFRQKIKSMEQLFRSFNKL